MTGYTVHTGSNDKFRDGWDKVFQSGKNRASTEKKIENKTGKDAGKKKQSKPR